MRVCVVALGFLVVILAVDAASNCGRCSMPKKHERVCGTNGKRYKSECVLLKRNCIDDTSIAVRNPGNCRRQYTQSALKQNVRDPEEQEEEDEEDEEEPEAPEAQTDGEEPDTPEGGYDGPEPNKQVQASELDVPQAPEAADAPEKQGDSEPADPEDQKEPEEPAEVEESEEPAEVEESEEPAEVEEPEPNEQEGDSEPADQEGPEPQEGNSYPIEPADQEGESEEPEDSEVPESVDQQGSEGLGPQGVGNSGPPVDCGADCPLELKPVCGSDGLNYPSACVLRRYAALPSKHDVVVADYGFCRTTTPVQQP